MAGKRTIDPRKLLARSADPGQLADFLERFDEGITAAFVDSDRKMPALRHERPAVYARGTYRRWQLDAAFRAAARKARMPIVTGTTVPPTWTFPILRTGAFSITLGIVDRHLAAGRRRLRCKGDYMKHHVARNSIVDPQGCLSFIPDEVKTIVPNGAIGAVIVVEGSVYQPDRPRYVGFWIPAPNLSRPLFRMKLDDLIAFLRRRAAAVAPRKSITAERKKPVRKAPERKLPRRKTDDGK